MSEKDPSTRPKLRGYVHLVGTIIAIPSVYALTQHAQSDNTTMAALLYGICLILLLGISAAYHTITWGPKAYLIFKRLDHSMIFVFIAGSYTPFLFVVGGESTATGIPLMWIAAALGVSKTFFFPRKNRWFTAIPYVIMGWIGMPYIPDIYRGAGVEVLGLILGSGLIYSLGAGVYARKWPDPFPSIFGYHEVFHLMVVLGVTGHFIAVWLVVGK